MSVCLVDVHLPRHLCLLNSSSDTSFPSRWRSLEQSDVQLFQVHLRHLRACRPDHNLTRVMGNKRPFQVRLFPGAQTLPSLPTRKYPACVEGTGYSPMEQIIHQFQLSALTLPFIGEGNWELNVLMGWGYRAETILQVWCGKEKEEKNTGLDNTFWKRVSHNSGKIARAWGEGGYFISAIRF